MMNTHPFDKLKSRRVSERSLKVTFGEHLRGAEIQETQIVLNEKL